MVAVGSRWTQSELLIALDLYFELQFGQFRQGHPRVQTVAAKIGRTPSALAMKLSNFAHLDKTLPQTGLKNVSNADRNLWNKLQQNPEDVEADTAAALTELEPSTVEAQSPETRERSETEVTSTRKSRRGQEIFRRAVLSAYKNRCCVTGITETRLLVASHIKPWRVDESNRLNPTNGLCLNVLHDKAFDIGLITVDEDYRIKLSPALKDGGKFLNASFDPYAGAEIALPHVHQPSQEFLGFHRQYIFVG